MWKDGAVIIRVQFVSMSNINGTVNSGVGIELSSIDVENGKNKRGDCWKFNISEQFPIIKPETENGSVVASVDSPHKGYSIQTTLVNGKASGESRILNEKNIKVASFVFVDGVANGPCKLYDEEGNLFFEGNFVNGYREGQGKEYNEEGHVTFEGYFEKGVCEGKGKELDGKGKVLYEGMYSKGKRTNVVIMKGMKGYWKEMNDRNEIVSICMKGESGENEGICYFYTNGVINKISEWKNGMEVNVLKRFEGKKMIEFENGVRRYEGEYQDCVENGYPREGEGEEYDGDGKSIVYHGHYVNNERQGKGKLYKNGDVVYNGKWVKGCRLPCFIIGFILLAILMIGCIVFMFIHSMYVAIALVSIDVLFGIVIGISGCCICSRKKKAKKLGITDKSNAKSKRPSRLFTWILVAIIVNIAFSLLYIGISIQVVRNYCLGSPFQSSLTITNDKCNYYFLTSFKPSSTLESIVVGNYCFKYVANFHVVGLSRLKRITIGSDSFYRWSRDGIVDEIFEHYNLSYSFRVMNCAKLESIEIGGYSFRRYNGYFELKNLPSLQSIEIGYVCFKNVDTFRIDGLNNLKSIKIGRDSFTAVIWASYGDDPSRSFHVLNCDKLESIEIGEDSFSDYSGEFELKNLPSLSSIKIGEIGSQSWNFYCSSFMIRDLPNLQSIQLGWSAFSASLSTIISNLPNLKSIQLGRSALESRNSDICSLEMKDLPQLEEITSNGYSFRYPRSVTLSNIPNLKTVQLPGSFRYVKTKSISNVSSLLANLVKINY